MHCPECGMLAESAAISYCTRCGFTLAGVRTLMSGEAISKEVKVPVGGVNMGVVLMFLGVLPALAAVFTSPIALPAAFLFVAVVWTLIQLGSGQLLGFFQPNAGPEQEGIVRIGRKEIAFGSTLMFIGTILSTLIVLGVPDSWARSALLTLIPSTFIALLLGSGRFYRVYREIASAPPGEIAAVDDEAAKLTSGLVTNELDGKTCVPAIGAFNNDPEYAQRPHSIVDETTRQLDRKDRSGTKAS